MYVYFWYPFQIINFLHESFGIRKPDEISRARDKSTEFRQIFLIFFHWMKKSFKKKTTKTAPNNWDAAFHVVNQCAFILTAFQSDQVNLTWLVFFYCNVFLLIKYILWYRLTGLGYKENFHFWQFKIKPIEPVIE